MLQKVYESLLKFFGITLRIRHDWSSRGKAASRVEPYHQMRLISFGVVS